MPGQRSDHAFPYFGRILGLPSTGSEPNAFGHVFPVIGGLADARGRERAGRDVENDGVRLSRRYGDCERIGP